MPVGATLPPRGAQVDGEVVVDELAVEDEPAFELESLDEEDDEDELSLLAAAPSLDELVAADAVRDEEPRLSVL